MYLSIQHLNFVQGCTCLYFAVLNLPSRREVGGPCCHRVWTVIPVRLLVACEQTDPRRVLEYISWLAWSFGHSWNKAKIGLLTKGNQFIGWSSPAPKLTHLGQCIWEGNSWAQIDSLRKKTGMQTQEQSEEVKNNQLIWRPSRGRHVQRENLNSNYVGVTRVGALGRLLRWPQAYWATRLLLVMYDVRFHMRSVHQLPRGLLCLLDCLFL